MSREPQPGGSRGRNAVALSVGTASFLDSSAIVGVGLGLALWREALDLTPLSVGLVGSALSLFVGIGALFGGWAADLMGHRRIFLATMALYAVAAAAVALAPDATWLVVAVIGLGLASGADLPASLTILSTTGPQTGRTRAVARTHVMWILGVVVTTAAGLGLSTTGLLGTRILFAALAVVAAATCLGRVRTRPRILAVPATRAPYDRRIPLGSMGATGIKDLALLGGFFVCITVVTNTFGTYRTYLTIVTTGAGQTAATALSLAMTTVVLLGSVVFARHADHRTARRLLFLVGALLVTSSQVAVAAGATTSILTLALALLAFSLGSPFASDAIYKVWVHETFPEDVRATAQGATYAAARVAAAVAALVTPTFIEASPALLFAGLAVLAASAGLLGGVVLRRSPSGRPEGT